MAPAQLGGVDGTRLEEKRVKIEGHENLSCRDRGLVSVLHEDIAVSRHGGVGRAGTAKLLVVVDVAFVKELRQIDGSSNANRHSKIGGERAIDTLTSLDVAGGVGGPSGGGGESRADDDGDSHLVVNL